MGVFILLNRFRASQEFPGGDCEDEKSFFLLLRDARGPGYFFACGNLSGIAPDGCGDVLITRFTFRCVAPGEAMISLRPIPDFDSISGVSGTIYDCRMTIPPYTLFSLSPLHGLTGCFSGGQPDAGPAPFPVCSITIE